MKTEMKKNNKMFLALAVIAALAMVSVAGVALNSEESEAIIIEPNKVTIEAGEPYTGDFSITDGGELWVLGTYSGTLKFYKGTEVKADDLVTVIEFTNVTNALIWNENAGEAGIATYNSKTGEDAQNVTGGTINVTQGKLMLGVYVGPTEEYYFAGTVSGKTMTLTSVNTHGAIIEVGTTDSLSTVEAKPVTKGKQYYTDAKGDKKPSDAKLTVSGTGVYKGTTKIGGAGVIELVIAEGATLTSYLPAAQTYTVTAAVTGTATYGKLLNADGTVAYNGTLADTKVTFTDVDVSKTYYVAIVTPTKDYFAKATFTVNPDNSVTHIYDDATAATFVSAVSGGLGKGATTGTTDTVFYAMADKVLYSTATANDATEKKLTFGSTGVGGVAYKITVFFINASGAPFFYNGTLKPHADTDGEPNILEANGTITDVVAPVTGGVPTSTLALLEESTLTVEGTLKASYTSAKVLGKIDNALGIVEVTGLIAYEEGTLGTANLTATAYSIKSTAEKTTNYYTTFNKALAASADITVYGEKVFLENQTWETGVADAEETKITFATGATATVGSFYEKDVSEDVFVTITVPETTTVTINGAKALGVVNGKIVFLKSGEADTPSAGIKSAVGMTEGTSYVYTDLSTALSTAVAEDIIKLRDEAKIAKDTKIIAGVKVIGASNHLIVYAGAIFTVSGELKGIADAEIEGAVGEKAAGKLIIDSEDFDVFGGMTVNGVLEITDKVGAEESWPTPCRIVTTAATSDVSAVIYIAGDVTNGNFIGNGFMTINVTGKLANVGTDEELFLGEITMNVIGGEFSYEYTNGSVEEIITNLNVTGKGIVKKAGAGVLTVTGKAVIGTPAKELAAVVNEANVTFHLETAVGAYAIVYGTAAKVTIHGFATATLFMNTSILYATVYGGGVDEKPVDTPEITGKKFMGYYDNPAFIGTNIYVNGVPVDEEGVNYYMKFDIAMTSITVDTPVGAVVKINGATYDGNDKVPYASSYTITVSALKGYNADNAKILLNGEPVTGTVQLKAGDVITVEGIEEASGPQESNIVVYLLIAITVIIAVIAVVVAVKLLRS